MWLSKSSQINSVLPAAPGNCSSQLSEKGQSGRKLVFSGILNHLLLAGESSQMPGQLGNVKAN